MTEITHALAEPQELTAVRRRGPPGGWGDRATAAARHAVRRQLNREQVGLCIYCERRLGEDEGHVDHIKPQGSNKDLIFVYQNLAHSCDGPSHCGHHKEGRLLSVEPRDGCNRSFSLLALDGRLAAATGLASEESRQAAETLQTLGLNAAGLARERKSYCDTIQYLNGPGQIAEFIAEGPFRWSLRHMYSIGVADLRRGGLSG